MLKKNGRIVRSALVTGGTGVTGNALVRFLLQKGVQVTTLIRPQSSRSRFLPQEEKGLRCIPCAMEDYVRIADNLSDRPYDVFFHLAWDGSMGKQKIANRDNFPLQAQNIRFAVAAVDLCHEIRCPLFLMTGSQAEYGRKDHPVNETEEKDPENGYGIAKFAAESMTRLMCQSYGITHIWPILFSIYGPYDGAQSLVDTTIRGLMNDQLLPYTAGEQQWDYLYSMDAARAIWLLAKYGCNGEAYHVANGELHPIHWYIKKIYELLAPDKTPRLGEIPYSGNQMMFLGADITKMRETTGFSPEYEFTSGIKKIYHSLKPDKG